MIWPPPNRALEGSVVRMEPIRPEHEEPLFSVSADEETWVWTDRRVPGDRAAFGSWFEERLTASKAAEEWCFVTVAQDRDEPIGSSSYLAIRPLHDGLEIGWTWLTRSRWRSGANIEAKLLMLGFAIEELGCMRVEFKTDARNERSRGALAALPATFEGIFRKHMHMPLVGVRDSAYFSITDEDWPEVKANLQRRLGAHAGAVDTAAGQGVERLTTRLDAFFDCVERGDLEGLTEIVEEVTHPDLVFRSGLTTALDGKEHVGHAGLREYFTDFLATVSIVYTEREYHPVSPEVILFLCTAEMRGKGSGAPVRQPIGQIIEYSGDLIVKTTSFTSQEDAKAAAEALTNA